MVYEQLRKRAFEEESPKKTNWEDDKDDDDFLMWDDRYSDLDDN